MKTYLLPNARLAAALLASLAFVACGQKSDPPRRPPQSQPDAALVAWDTSVSGQEDTESEPDAAQTVDAAVQADVSAICTTPLNCPGVDGTCQTRTCTAGVCGVQNAKVNTPCGSKMLCDGEGQCVGCLAPSDCPGSDNECGTRTCTAGVCGSSFVAKGTALSTQQTGDCHRRQCDGAGNISNEVDDSDLPVDGLPCTRDLCQGGTPNNPPAPASFSCGTDLYCDGTGACVSCVQPSDCGTDTECQVRTCLAGCGVQNVAAGTSVAQQVAGDCHTIRCDGSGATTDAVDDTDLPVDGNPCTSDLCAQGVKSNPPLAAGTACGTGLFCDGKGACVGCRQPSDCGGADTECQVRTCIAGVCGLQNTATDTAVSKQVAGDCHTVRCNGSGATTNAIDDTDLPVDENPCTRDVCTLGVKSNPRTTAGTTCPTGVCNGTGTCVGCVEPADCSGVDTECQIRTCTDGTCGVSKTPAGTVLASQVAGDCHRKSCDGNGGINDNEDNSDLPLADGNQCTTEICTSGSGSHPPATRGTTCNQNGGAFCDGAGACVACLAPSDCPGTDNDCRTRTCSDGVCGFAYLPTGTAAATQIAGDCHRNLCGNEGVIDSVVDDSDLPVDGKECTSDLCTAGVSSNPPLAANTACGLSGSNYCDGAGACVGCLAPADCGSNTECQTRTCDTGVCGVSNTSSGTPVSSQTPGDCKRTVCDGLGGTRIDVDDADLPDDGKQCTSDVCTDGTPSNPPLASSTACTQNDGHFCNGAGACVECLTKDTCPGTDTGCGTRTCSGGTCGFSYVANGGDSSTQTPGDCHKNVCDGLGGSGSVVDNTDVPVDLNQCTSDLCTDGTPSNPPLASSTACTQNDGHFCNGAGACVECVTKDTCPGTDTGCGTRTCSGGTCGFSYVANGGDSSTQTAGDCHRNTCDGAGNSSSVVDNADVPVDLNQCTSDLCTDGTPSNPPLASSTACTQSGGRVCDGAGACVECLAPSDCGTNECLIYTCTAGVCGSHNALAGTICSSGGTVCDGNGACVAPGH